MRVVQHGGGGVAPGLHVCQLVPPAEAQPGGAAAELGWLCRVLVVGHNGDCLLQGCKLHKCLVLHAANLVFDRHHGAPGGAELPDLVSRHLKGQVAQVYHL